MIKIVAKKLIKEDQVEKFKEIAKELEEKSSVEDGNEFYSINVSLKNPRLFAFIEGWRDQDALDKHNATEHFQRLVPQIGPMCEEAVTDFFTEL